VGGFQKSNRRGLEIKGWENNGNEEIMVVRRDMVAVVWWFEGVENSSCNNLILRVYPS